MMLSVMVVGAGAAFSDQSKIKNTEAVDACTALNIIGGYPDGSFKPEGNITRAEVTKMICVALNGGKNPAVSTNTTPTFSDVRNNANAAWAEGYIESCVAQGIVSGVGGGKFAPAGNVTGVQLAKMLLVALGYNSDIESFTGNAWATNVNVRATQRGLYDGLEKMDTAAAISRDNAAQMVWNALQALEVKYDYTLVSDKGNLTSTTTLVEKNITLLADKYSGAGVYEGVLTGSGKYALDDKTGKDKVFMAKVDKIDGKVAPKNLGAQKWDCDKDMTALLGQYVKVLVNNKSDAYGVFPVEDENTVATAAFKDVKIDDGKIDDGKIDDGKIKVNGTSYNYDKNDITIEGVKKDASNGLKVSDLTNTYAEVASGDQITFISNDGDDTFDRAIVNPLKSKSGSLDKVTYVSSTEFVAGGETYKFEDVIAPTDLKKGDYVAYYENTFTGDKQFVKATEVKGKVTSTKDSGKEVKIGDNWYTVGNKTTNYPFYNALVRKGDEVTLNSTVTVQVINDVIYYADSNGAASTDTALVLAATGSMNADGDYQVKLLFADGTTKLVAADKAYTSLDDTMVTWEINDDLYELTAVSATNLAGGDSYGTSRTGFVKSSKKLADKKVASDATIYVNYKDGNKQKQKVLSGSELNALGSDFDGSVTYVVDDGLISLAYINSTAYLPGANATQVYGYVVSTVTENNENNTKYKQYDVYTTEGKLVEGVKQKATTAVAKGDYIKLSLSSDNYAEGVEVLNIDAKAGALLNYGKDYISLVKPDHTSDIVSLDDNVKYLVVNTKDVKGVGNEADLEKAAETGTANEYYANVSYYVEPGNTDAVLVVIDSTGKWFKKDASSETKITQTAATNPTTMTVAAATNNALTVSSGTISAGAKIEATDYNASSANQFKVSLTPAADTTATMTLTGDILKDGDVTLASGSKDNIAVTGKGIITGKIIVEQSGKATNTINFTIEVK